MQFRNGLCATVIAAWVAFPALSAETAASDTVKDDHVAELREHANQGYVRQQKELARAYLSGTGVKQDPEKAAYWYGRAAKMGDPEAENELGYFYQKGIGVRADAERAVHWYQLSSAAGLSWGKVNLAVCYLKGTGVAKSPSTARKFLLEAIEKGEGLAAAYLGDIELLGLDGPEDVTAGERWFKTGVRLHDPVSAYNLAFLNTTSEKHAHDLRAGLELLRSAARKGYVPALHALGLLLVNHPELPQAEREARDTLERASSAGNWKATAILAVLARDGRGTPKDQVMSFYYFHLAALQGGAAGEKAVARDVQALSHRLSSHTQSAAADRADAWFQNHRVELTFVSTEKDNERASALLSLGQPAM